MQTFLLLLPDFALILAGAALRRYGGFGEAFWSGLERLVYFVLFPALLFSALTRATLDMGETAPLTAAGLLSMFVGFMLAFLAKPWMGLSPIGFASRQQCAYRFNTYIGIAVAGKVHGVLGVATMGTLCGAMVPFANLAAVAMIARHGQGRLLRELSRNPLILATLAGLLFNLGGLTVPAPASDFLRRLADASIALGLLAVGAALRMGSAGGHPLGSVWIVVVKLVVLPMVAWLLAAQFGMTGEIGRASCRERV